MARQLAAAGQTVALLALIDVPPPGVRAAWEEEEVDLMAWFARDLAALSGQRVAVSPADLRRIPADDRLRRVVAAAQAAHLLPPDIGLAEAESLFAVFRATQRALGAYVPSPYPGSALLVLAGDPVAEDGQEAAPEAGAPRPQAAETSAVPKSVDPSVVAKNADTSAAPGSAETSVPPKSADTSAVRRSADTSAASRSTGISVTSRKADISAAPHSTGPSAAPERAWAPLILGDLTVERIACEHYTIVRPPYVEALAALLRARIGGVGEGAADGAAEGVMEGPE
jgi:thioesterase domain-containing protein